MHNFVKTLFSVLLLFFSSVLTAQNRMNDARDPNRIWLDSEVTHHGDYQWKMIPQIRVRRYLHQIIRLKNGCQPLFPVQS